MSDLPRVSLHRFRDAAALAVLRAPGTVYLTVDAAEQLAAALTACAASIRAQAFAESDFAPCEVPAKRHGAAAPAFRRFQPTEGVPE